MRASINVDSVPQVAARTDSPKFGQLLKSLRRRANLSQAELGRFVGKEKSTIARIESGGRLPPRDVEFYDRLLTVPGFTTEDISALLTTTTNAPRWLIPDAPGNAEGVSFPIAGHDGLVVELRIRPGFGVRTQVELERLSSQLKEDVEWRLTAHRREKEKEELVLTDRL